MSWMVFVLSRVFLQRERRPCFAGHSGRLNFDLVVVVSFSACMQHVRHEGVHCLYQGPHVGTNF